MSSEERFGYEWGKWSEINRNHKNQFLKWVHPLNEASFRKKTVLDVGCGNGRNSYWILEAGAKRIVCIDYDKRTIRSAKNNLKEFKNKEIKFQSVYSMDYNNEFDIALSIGVVHHLEDPKKAIRKMLKAVKRGGKVLIWVYGYESNEWIVKYINPLRKSLTSKMPLVAVDALSYLFVAPLYIYLKLVPQKNEYLKQLSDFEFGHVRIIVFDQLIPTIANYWRKDEVLELFSGTDAKDIRIYKVNNNSWTAIATKG